MIIELPDVQSQELSDTHHAMGAVREDVHHTLRHGGYDTLLDGVRGSFARHLDEGESVTLELHGVGVVGAETSFGQLDRERNALGEEGNVLLFFYLWFFFPFFLCFFFSFSCGCFPVTRQHCVRIS